MSPPEKLKRKLLTPDAEGDERRRTGVIRYALSTILRMAGAQQPHFTKE